MNIKINFCPSCGSEIIPNSRFCNNCGLNLEELRNVLNASVPPEENKHTITLTEKANVIPNTESFDNSNTIKSNNQGPLTLESDQPTNNDIINGNNYISSNVDNKYNQIINVLNSANIPGTYIGENIPEKKLSNSILSIAPGIEDRNVIAIIDDTFFGSAKSGAVFSCNSIFIDDENINNVKIDYDDCQNITLIKEVMQKTDGEYKNTMKLSVDVNGKRVEYNTDSNSLMSILTITATLLSNGAVNSPEIQHVEQTEEEVADNNTGLNSFVRAASKIYGQYKDSNSDIDTSKNNNLIDNELHYLLTFAEINYYINHPLLFPGYIQTASDREKAGRLSDITRVVDSSYSEQAQQLTNDEIINFIGDSNTLAQWENNVKNNNIDTDDLNLTREILLEAQKRDIKINRVGKSSLKFF